MEEVDGGNERVIVMVAVENLMVKEPPDMRNGKLQELCDEHKS